jgi:hypothetical protein
MLVHLLDALSDLPGRPPDLKSFLAAAPPASARPSPWLTWPLLAPDWLRGFVHQGLWSYRPEARLTAAAVLALRDDAWSRGELRALLAVHHRPDATGEARAALCLSRDPGAQAEAEEVASRINRTLDLSRAGRDPNSRVVIARLPDGRDPADCSREEIWKAARAALRGKTKK